MIKKEVFQIESIAGVSSISIKQIKRVSTDTVFDKRVEIF